VLLTISTTHEPATDLGHLLHKNPERVQTFDLSLGRAHVFYPEASARRCTAALLLDIDPLGLARRRGSRRYDYVNDRPYVASSFLSVALAGVFGSALKGRSTSHGDLAAAHLPLVATLAAVPSSGGADLVERLFAPLGWDVDVSSHPVDEAFPAWGASRYVTLRLSGHARLRQLLEHLYVLLPVLDNDKHYWFGRDEIDKLLHRGGDWVASHPDKQLIVERYLRYRRRLTTEALEHLISEDIPDLAVVDGQADESERVVEDRVRLADARIGAVLSALKAAGAQRVLDAGCGAGSLVKVLMDDASFTAVGGMDVSTGALEAAGRHLRLDRLPPRQRERLTLFQGSLTYRDDRLRGWDALACVEVVEHLDPPRLDAFAQVVFGHGRPATVVVTTPNREYNPLFLDRRSRSAACFAEPGSAKFGTLPSGQLRHRDHRFEWTRAEFAGWTGTVAQRYGYQVRHLPVGPEDADAGPPTQMAVFARRDP
jgi:3' terminal RNA ribose 2'-O-methyltransferase Hen1